MADTAARARRRDRRSLRCRSRSAERQRHVRRPRVARDRDDVRIVGVQQRLADGAAMHLELRVALRLEPFDDDEIDGREVRHELAQRRLGARRAARASAPSAARSRSAPRARRPADACASPCRADRRRSAWCACFSVETVRPRAISTGRSFTSNVVLPLPLQPASPISRTISPCRHRRSRTVCGARSTRAAQYLNSGILPNGSSFGFVSRFAGLSAKQNGMKTMPSATSRSARKIASSTPRRVSTVILSPW